MHGVNGAIVMQHAVHHSESRQDSASQQEVIVAEEIMRNRSLARLTPVQVSTSVISYIKSIVLPSLVVPMNYCVRFNNN